MIKKYQAEPTKLLNTDTDNINNSEPVDNDNTMGDVFQAFKKAILSLKDDLTIHEEGDDENTTPYFQTIVVDNGQFERLMSQTNTEYETAFPACFIRFTNVHFLVAQQRIGEGRATARIRFILNKLDNQHVQWETFPFQVAELVNKAIQKAKDTEEPLQERCNLMYFDMPQSTNMLQAYWLDYEIYFRITSSYKYNDWIKKKVITPPFTNHSDVPDGKENVKEPTYKESSTIQELSQQETN